MDLFLLIKQRLILFAFLLFALISGCKRSSLQNSFLSPPQIIFAQERSGRHKPENRKFTGIPSLSISNNNQFWATWYAGTTPGEDFNNYVVISKSIDDGNEWDEVAVIDPDGSGPVRAFDPETWVDPNGKIWFFWAQSIDNEEATAFNGRTSGVWAITYTESNSSGINWSSPKRIADGIMMCKPTVLSTGEWLLPVSIWKIENSARILASVDNGNSWKIRGEVNVPEEYRDCDEHMLLEKKNGSLMLFVRTRYGIGESISYDTGKTWTPLLPSLIKHPNARFFIRRLNSGNILLVKHGPIELVSGRTHLMAFISKDDGITWSEGLLIDERYKVSYPDGQETKDSIIYIIYDYNRTRDQMILMTRFKEADINSNSDSCMINVFNERRVVSQGGIKLKKD